MGFKCEHTLCNWPPGALCPGRGPSGVPFARDRGRRAERGGPGDHLGGAGCAGAHDQLIVLEAALKTPVVHAFRGKESVEYDDAPSCMVRTWARVVVASASVGNQKTTISAPAD